MRQWLFNWLLQRRQQEVGAKRIIYLDETGLDERDGYGHGWSQRGKRLMAQCSGRRGKRLNVIAAIRATCSRQLIEPYVFEGSCNTQVMEVWLDRLCQTLPQDKKHYLVLDNAAFHKGVSLQRIVQAYGHELMFLPPYSPELNPIERCWSTLKHHVGLLLNQGKTLMNAIEQVCSLY